MNCRPDSIIHFRLHYFHTEYINSFFVTDFKINKKIILIKKKTERERERENYKEDLCTQVQVISHDANLSVRQTHKTLRQD